MALSKKRCEKTLDLFGDGGNFCEERLAELIAEGRRLYTRRPTPELLGVKLALSFHGWRNTLQEQARLSAVTDLLNERHHPPAPPQPEEPAIRRIPGTDLVIIRRRRRD